MFNLLAGYLIDALQPYAMWITVGLVVAIAIAGTVILFAKKELFGKFFKIAAAAFAIYALTVGIILLIFDVIKHYDPDYLDHNYVNKDVIYYVFIPVLVTLCLMLASAVTLIAVNRFKPEYVKKTAVVCGIACALALITSVIPIALFYTNHIVGDGYYTEGYGELNSTALYISAAVLVSGTVAVALIAGRKDKSGFDTRCIAFAGITVALSFTLSYVKLWKMPQGGSVTLVSMLPVMLFSYVYGAKKGVLIGLIYGILQSLQDPFIVHPAQFLLDYPIAYAVTGLAGCLTYTGVFRKKPQLRFAVSAFIGATLKFISQVLSGVFAFGAYAKDAGASNTLVYSLVYNSVVLIDVALVIVVGIILFSSGSFNRELRKFNTDAFADL